MKRRWLIALGAAFLFALPAGAKDWQGTMLPDQPTQFIFGYGSLINSASRNATAGKTIPAIPVRVSAAFGYIRAWDDRSTSGFTALGLRKPGPGEKASTINGVLYPVDGDDMAKYDVRERGYARVEVPRDDIEAMSWQRLASERQDLGLCPRQAERRGRRRTARGERGISAARVLYRCRCRGRPRIWRGLRARVARDHFGLEQLLAQRSRARAPPMGLQPGFVAGRCSF